VAVTGYEILSGNNVVGTVASSPFTLSGLSPATKYSVTVRAFDAAGNKSASSAVLAVTTAAPPDTTAPSVPTGLLAANVTTSGFTLTWAAATDNVGVTGYNIYRNGTYVTTIATRSYVFTGLAANTTYNITILAMDAAKNRSALSAPLSVKTLSAGPDTAAPSVPSGLLAANITTSGFTVTWNASTDNVGVTGYNIYRNGTYVTTTAIRNYVFTGLAANTTYSITILAMDAAKNRSALSAPLSVKTLSNGPDTTAPSVPGGLNASNVTTSGFRIAWTAATDNIGVTGYNVYRNGAYVTTVGTTNYTFTGLSANTTYSITVLALDAAKNRSAQSTALAVKTLTN
jgi:chitodextrinase